MLETANPTTEAKLRRLVSQAGAVLDGLGLVDYLGHCSARLPGTDHLVVKPKHSPNIRRMNQLTPQDMVIVDLDGAPVRSGERPPTEVFIHTEIYRARPDASAVVHTHQPKATLMGTLDQPILPLLHVPASFVPTNPPTWPRPVLVDTPNLGRELAQHLDGEPFCHLRGHGIISVANNVREATVGAVMLEKLAEANLDALQTGLTPHIISKEDLDTLRRQLAGPEGRWAYYLQITGVEG